MLAHRARQDVRALVPAQEVDVRGRAFGLWVQPKRVLVSILVDKATITYRDNGPQDFSFHREVVLNKGRLEPSVLPAELSVDVVTKKKVGNLSRIAGRTWANSRVYAFGPDGFEEIPLTRGGTFAVQVPGDLPAPGTLVAVDSVGRWAEFDHPSRRLEQVLHDLKTGRDRQSPVPKVQATRPPQLAPRRAQRQERRESRSDTPRPERRDKPERPNKDKPLPEGDFPSGPSIDELEDEELDESAL